MAWRITSRRRHETRSPAPAIVLRDRAGNVILGARDGASGCHPETRSSTSRIAFHSAALKRETRRAESRLVKREMRRGGSPFQAASSRHGGGMVAVRLGLQGVLGGGFPARWYEQLCGGPGRCAAVPERTVALQGLTLRWQPAPLRVGPLSGSEATHPGGYPFSRPLAATPSTSASPTWRRVRRASAAARRRDGASLAEGDGSASPGDAWPHRHVARHERATQRCGPFGDDDARVSSTARAAAPTSRPQAGRRSATLPRAAINDRARATPPWRYPSMRPTSARGPSALDGAAASAPPRSRPR
jgi:hypothetical protein